MYNHIHIHIYIYVNSTLNLHSFFICRNGTVIFRQDLIDRVFGVNQIKNIDYYTIINDITYQTSVKFNNYRFYHDQAVLYVILYIFIAIVLIFGYGIITNDVQRLVLAPIERMMNMVDEVSRNPLQKLQFDHDKTGISIFEMS
jgi:hypothetical protein